MSSGQQSSLDTSIDQYATVLLNQLKKYKAWDRGPRQLSAIWQAVSNAQEDATEKIVLENGGRSTWFIFSIIESLTENANYHFEGRPECEKLFEQLDTLPQEDRKRLATQLAQRLGAQIPRELHEKVDKLFRKKINPTQDGGMSEQPRKRRKTIDVDIPIPNDDPSGSGTSTSDVRQPTVTSSAPNPTTDTARDSALRNRLPKLEQIFIDASLKQTMDLFPAELADAIVTRPHSKDQNIEVAEISISFPNAQMTQIQCQMSIQIKHEKAPDFLRTLFGVKLETVAGLRYVSLPGGSELLPDPRLIFRRGRCECLPAIFGEVITRAISTSPGYILEARRYRNLTHSVWALITPFAEEPLIINLSLGLVEGTDIRKRLFGK